MSHARIDIIAPNIAQLIEKTIIAFAGAAVSGLDVIGWIMIIGPVLDLFFAFISDLFESNQYDIFALSSN